MPQLVPNPRTRFIRPFTTHILNPFTRLFVHRLPGFAILFALTYGSDVQWVKNILAAGEADLRIGDKTIHLTDPEVFVDPKRRLMPPHVRFMLGVMRVSEFLRMHLSREADALPTT